VDTDYLFGNLVSVFLPLVQRVEAPSYSYPNNTFVLCSLSGDPIAYLEFAYYLEVVADQREREEFA
jgi:hypothetical protein